jgi:hypothetical protein
MSVKELDNDFVPSQEALALKELRFDADDFFGFWNLYDYSSEWKFDAKIQDDCIHYIEAPTFQQAFRFFRDKYGYYQSIEIHPTFNKWLSRWCNVDGSMGAIAVHDNYTEAELACIQKFIELVKNKR